MTPIERLLFVAKRIEDELDEVERASGKTARAFHERRVRDIRIAVDDLTPRYTAEVPTEPGWYWWKTPDGTTGTCKFYRSKDRVYQSTGGPLGVKGSLWSGPILEPVEEGKPDGEVDLPQCERDL